MQIHRLKSTRYMTVDTAVADDDEKLVDRAFLNQNMKQFNRYKSRTASCTNISEVIGSGPAPWQV